MAPHHFPRVVFAVSLCAVVAGVYTLHADTFCREEATLRLLPAPDDESADVAADTDDEEALTDERPARERAV